jgi:hypothetical protein
VLLAPQRPATGSRPFRAPTLTLTGSWPGCQPGASQRARAQSQRLPDSEVAPAAPRPGGLATLAVLHTHRASGRKIGVRRGGRDIRVMIVSHGGHGHGRDTPPLAAAAGPGGARQAAMLSGLSHRPVSHVSLASRPPRRHHHDDRPGPATGPARRSRSPGLRLT